jgi:hypothetical protein
MHPMEMNHRSGVLRRGGSFLLAVGLVWASCATSGDVEKTRQEQAQAKAKMSAELQQEREQLASMEKESEARQTEAEKLAKALGGKGKTAATLGSTSCSTTSGQLNVQVVNDSGPAKDDNSSVYLLLTGKGIGMVTANNLQYLDIETNPNGSATAGVLSAMTSCGTFTSPYTGNTRKIYQFSVKAIASGRLMVSYNKPVAVTNGNFPTATGVNFRWDKMEFGYPNSGADLTSMDFFGIPMQFDYLDANGNVLTTMTYYTSTPTLLNALYNLSPTTMGTSTGAFQQISTGSTPTYGWAPANGLTNFARILSPPTIAAGANNGSPAPYPSFGTYLTSVINQSFTLSGNGNAGCPPIPYSYTGAVTSDKKGGYIINLSGTTNGTPCGINAQGELSNLPRNLPIQVALPVNSFDFYVYGAPATAFTVPGLPANLQPYVANSLYAVIAGNFLAGMNFGYVGSGSNAPQNSANWYSNPPTLYPFAGARKTNDGHYNPYAAIFYNLSDAYGFAYSDRGGRPSPYVPLPSNATTMRITLLNDTRLDAPMVTVSKPTNTSLTISWPAVTNATGYTVNVSYGGGIAVSGASISPPTQSGSTWTSTISNLSPGTTYQINATATGSNSIQSYTVPVYGTTSGTISSPTGSTSFQAALNWPTNPVPGGLGFTLNNNNPYTPGSTVSVSGNLGSPIVYGLTVTQNSTPIYQGNYVMNVTQSGSSNYILNAFLTPPNSQPLNPAWSGGGCFTPCTISTFLPMGFVMAGTFQPVALKQFFPVQFPSQ